MGKGISSRDKEVEEVFSGVSRAFVQGGEHGTAWLGVEALSPSRPGWSDKRDIQRRPTTCNWEGQLKKGWRRRVK